MQLEESRENGGPLVKLFRLRHQPPTLTNLAFERLLDSCLNSPSPDLNFLLELAEVPANYKKLLKEHFEWEISPKVNLDLF